MSIFTNNSIFKRIQLLQITTLLGALLGVFLIIFTILEDYIENEHEKY